MESFSNAKSALVSHLIAHAVRTNGPFTLRSGEVADWYIDARQTTFDGAGARLVGKAVLEHVPQDVDAVGGMTMGADPISVATALVAAERGRALSAFSIREVAKNHGTGGRLVGPVSAGSRVAAIEDTTTTGSALVEAIGVLRGADVVVTTAIALVDRSEGATEARMTALGVAYVGLVAPVDLGVGS